MQADTKRISALFISDLHLQPAQPAITAAFHAFMEQQAPAAASLYLLSISISVGVLNAACMTA